jgi:hypothetical protein
MDQNQLITENKKVQSLAMIAQSLKMIEQHLGAIRASASKIGNRA